MYTLWNVAVQFSAMHSARWSGNRKFISAGASVPGVIWNSIRTPSTTSSEPVAPTSSVGAIRPKVPSGVVWPSPLPTSPCGPLGRRAPYM